MRRPTDAELAQLLREAQVAADWLNLKMMDGNKYGRLAERCLRAAEALENQPATLAHV